MSEDARHKSVLSWALDATVAGAGLLIGLVGVLSFLSSGALDLHWGLALLVGAPMTALMSRFPLVLGRDSNGIEVGFESAILVFLACYHGGAGALAVWTLGIVLSQALTNKRPLIKAFNMGIGILAGYVALLVMRGISPLVEHDGRELAAVTLGCAAFFVVDYVVSAVSLALEESTPVTAELRQSRGFVALGTFVAIDSIGYLTALVVRNLPGWPGLLLVVPLATILVATRALSRGSEHQRRLVAMFDAAAEAQVVTSEAVLEDLLRRYGRAAVGHRGVDLRTEGPEKDEIGARVRTGHRTLWLVAPGFDRARATVEADQKAIEALATVGEEAFARLALTAEMGHLARHDALTSLPNRTLFLDRVEQAVLRARRSGGSLAVLFLDLDGFKGVNDRFGHAEGDELLKAVAARLVACVRAEDSVARLGGDEFAVLVEGVEHPSEMDALCQRLLRSLRREITIVGHDVVVGASIGVAISAPSDDAAGLLRNADMAMYRAKALGKDRFFVYQPSLREENVRRLELVEALRRDIATRLVVHYQPVIDLERGVVDGLEALVRWQRPEGLVSPDTFIAAAEESGLIGELGARVLAQVVADAPVLEAAAGHPIHLGCNMSAHQLRDSAFLGQVGEAVRQLGDNQLVLEMTETVVVSDNEDTDQALRTLKALGARLAIDDFGVGFSSIGYLQHLPVDSLKIDRTFTRDLDTSPRAAALVEAILVMASALDLTVVAEGIERPEQLARLHRVGCTYGQGFLLGRPQPLSEAVRQLRDRSFLSCLERSPVTT
ncbi:MAG TPA: EAL domain-containing protein [Actinomycetes bacterium]|nr:EAL domain-containing protein [Actinomycetes bacterium]